MPERLIGLMATPLGPVIALLAGIALGLVFYGGLWWTVLRAATFRRPGPGVLASLLLRMAITLVGFHVVAGGDWTRMLLCLMGFLLARAAVTWYTRLPSDALGAHHAP